MCARAISDASGQYSCTALYGWSGTVTPSLSGYTFVPASRDYTNVTANQAAQNYAANPPPVLSGTVTANGVALGNVAFTATAGGVCTPSNATGQYSCTVPQGWSGSVTPTLNGYAFSPMSRSYGAVAADQSAQDYAASPAVPLSGTVTAGGTPMSGVTVTASSGGSCTVSNASGQYSCNVPQGWTGSVTPSLVGYGFTPASRQYTNVADPQTAQDFAAAYAGATTVYYIHPDHLGTPRLIADANQNTVWRWDNQEPFGNDVPNDDPGSTGNHFDFPLRFPGQYYDKETNLAYNYFRDYDPGTGRYVESDPIGLGGGVNSYAYVWQSPLMFIDSFGLRAECWWNDLGNTETCQPTGLRRQKPTGEHQTTEWFPAPDPTSPSIGVAPIPPMPEPGIKLVWRIVFWEKGYWEAELECKVFAMYVCRDECGKITFVGGNRYRKKWERDSDYDEITGYGSWSNVGTPSGPYDLDVNGGGRPTLQPSPRPR